MSYGLGIDLGASVTSAAICRPGAGGTELEIVPLGAGATGIASVLYLGADGSFLVGQAAEQRVLTEPDRVFRQLKQRIGNDLTAPVSHRPENLAARMVRWVVDTVAECEEEAAASIAFAYPATWGPQQRDVLAQALEELGVGIPTFVAEPEAAALSRATAAPVDVGSSIAVFDFGGGSFDAAVVRTTAPGTFTMLDAPLVTGSLCGADFEEAVFSHVLASLGGRVENADLDDPDVLASMARLLERCVEAKEALSTEAEVTIPVLLPGVQSQVRLTRGDFESLIRPALAETVEAMSTAIRSQVQPEDLDEVLLVGGSSQVPLVARLLSTEFQSLVTVHPEPQAAVALGAALAASPVWESAPGPPAAVLPLAASPVPESTPGPPATVLPGTPIAPSVSWEHPQATRAAVAPQPEGGHKSRRRLAAAAAAASLAAVLVPLTIMGMTDPPPPLGAAQKAPPAFTRPAPVDSLQGGGSGEKPSGGIASAPARLAPGSAPAALRAALPDPGNPTRSTAAVAPAGRPPAAPAPPPRESRPAGTTTTASPPRSGPTTSPSPDPTTPTGSPEPAPTPTPTKKPHPKPTTKSVPLPDSGGTTPHDDGSSTP